MFDQCIKLIYLTEETLMNKTHFSSIVLSICAMSASAGGDAAVGKTKAAMCAACHGAKGINAHQIYPNLAGQKELYLIKQLKDFKSGRRKAPIMAAMVTMLSVVYMENVSAYYATIK